MHENGFAGHAADPAQAAAWYEKAGRRRLWEAQAALAELYAQGRGVPRDPWQACFWYALADGLVELTHLGEKDALAARAKEACASEPTREGIDEPLEATRCAVASVLFWLCPDSINFLPETKDEKDRKNI